MFPSVILNSKGVLFHSPKGTSGYADAGKRAVHKLCEQNIPVSWHQFSIDDSKNDVSDGIYQSIQKTINKNIDFDTAIFCCSPDCWFDYIEKFRIKFLKKKVIGYPTWETNKIPDLWVRYCNLTDEIWTPSKFNKEIFERCGVEVPIKVVPYPFIKKSLVDVDSQNLTNLLSVSKIYGNNSNLFKYGPDWMVFYLIGEWNDRKNIESSLKCFCKTFKKDDNVKLILKIHHTNYNTNNKLYCKYSVENVLKKFPNHPEVLLITENISDQQILLIHSIGNCFFSLTRGEGFCLDAWDAFNYKKDILITGFGGHCDYLGSNHNGYINFELTNVDFKEKNILYSGDQRWADPDFETAISKLKSVYLNFTKTIDTNSTVSYSIDKVTENLPNRSCGISFNKKTKFDTVETVDKISLSELEVVNDSEFSGITYIGQYGTSGYATAAKGNLIHFFTKGIPITWMPLYFDNSKLSDECFYNTMAISLINRPIENFDTVFLHSTPDIWPELREKHKNLLKNKKVIGYTVWETSKLPYLWVESINECVDEVWCPSNYNKEVFENSRVIVPIKVFPHIFMPKELPPKECVFLNKSDCSVIKKEDEFYTFYNISELNPRKGVEDLVKTFCETFTDRDKVRLILKVHFKNYNEDNKNRCFKVLSDIVSCYKNPPKIHIILNNLTEKEILGLHSIGDCYVSLCKSEGFGLTIFEAFKYGKKIITTGYSGHVDFLGNNYEGLVQYNLGDVVGMEEFSKFYSEKDQQWAYPNLEHAKKLMIKTTKL